MRRADSVPAWRRYLRFWRSNLAADVDEELRFHTEMRVAEYMADGMSEREARQAVSARLGDVDAARARCVELDSERERAARQADLIHSLVGDLRFALRSMRRAPGWTSVVLLTIALGVGASTTVFRVADALLVHPFPYPDADRVFLARRQFTIDGHTVPVSLPIAAVREWRAHARTIDAVAPYSNGGTAQLGSGADVVTVHVARIDTSFLGFAGAHPLIGRNFSGDEMIDANEMNARVPAAVLLTEPFWRRRFGASPDVVGRVIHLDGIPRTVVGVVPASVVVPDFRAARADIFVPLPLLGVGSVLVRLKKGVSRSVAAELDGIFKRAQIPDVRPAPGEMPLHLTQPQDWLEIRKPLVMLTVAVALLLLVACANVAHLLLARGAARERELAVRHALGAGRLRLVRQLATETILLAAIGGVLAVVVGWAGLRVIAVMRPADLVALTYVRADSRVVAIAAVVAVACGLTIGVLAALRTVGTGIARSLRASMANTRDARRVRGALVVGEVALSAMLLVGALLLIHAVFGLQRRNLGFDARGLYEVAVRPRTLSPTASVSVPVEMRERLARFPGVQGVTLASSAPGPRHWRFITLFETPGHEISAELAAMRAGFSTSFFVVAPNYFSLLRMPLIQGRGFDDGSYARRDVIVSASLAKLLAPGGSPIGLRFRNAVSKTRGVLEPWQTIVGVVPDVVTSRVELGDATAIYRPVDVAETIGAAGNISLVVRLGAAADVAALRRALDAVADTSAQVDIVSVRDAIDETLAEPRFTMRILAGFSVVGVVLAAIGLFGVISYTVAQRTREIGVRMTLGATRVSIARLVVGDGLRLGAIGVAVGLLGAVATSRLIEALLYGVPRLDPFAFGAGCVTLLAVCVVACIVPMWRATAVDPAVAVRAE